MISPADVFAAAVRALESGAAANLDRWGPATALLSGADTVWCAGIGKSGLVARKLAGTLASRGRRAIFLHPVEALHGDSGGVRPGDVLVAVSQSGHTAELLRLVWELGLPTLALSRPGTPLAGLAVALLDSSVPEEAGGALPVSSFALACTLADALALGLDGQVVHPGGYIGALDRPVRELMLPPPMVPRRALLRDVIPHLSLGAVLLEGGGIFTDGDLRRTIAAEPAALEHAVERYATLQPVTVAAGDPARVAVERMERRTSQIAVLPVVEGGVYVGLVRLHDLVRAGLGV